MRIELRALMTFEKSYRLSCQRESFAPPKTDKVGKLTEKGRGLSMHRRASGFTLLEVLVVVMIMGIIALFTLPQAAQAVKVYKFHANAQTLAATLGLARLRATSQFRPYRVNMDWVWNWTGSMWQLSYAFSMEKLCGNQTSGCIPPPWVPNSCTQPYYSLSPNQIEGGFQPLGENSYWGFWNPGGTTTYPGGILPGSPASANSGAPGVWPTTSQILPWVYASPWAPPYFYGPGFYFNTRGVPVGCDGNPLPNGGEVIYLSDANGSIWDAVTVSAGGRVGVYQWVPPNGATPGQWMRR